MAELNTADGVKPEGQVASAPASDAPATPPTGEQPGAATQETEQPEGKVPYPRFKEVVDERNGMRGELAELRKLIENRMPQGSTESRADRVAKELVKEGVEEGAAKLIARTAERIAQEVAEERIRPLAESTNKRETDSWVEDFKKSAPDYDAMEPAMYKVFMSLPDSMKNEVVKNPKGIEFVYKLAKAENSGKAVAEAKAQGAEQAYKNKDLKKSLTSGGAGSAVPPNKTLTRAEVGAMSLDEYRSRRAEILKLATEGKL